MVYYEKVMTRDAPLVIVEAWWRSFTESVPEATGVTWPEPVFRYRNGVVESWRASERFHHIVPKKLAKQLADSQGARRRLLAAIRDYQYCAAAIRRLPVGNAQQALRTLAVVIDFFIRGCAGLIPAYWCAEWDARERNAGRGALFPKRILSVAQKIRECDTFFDDAMNKAYACLHRVANARRLSWRALDGMLLDEILCDVVPSVQELQRRHAGYVYVGGKVWTGKAVAAAVGQRGYVLREVIHGKEDVIRGAVAFRGIIKGRVVVCISPKDIGKVRRGDILVAAMTTPRYLPAMQKAAAFVTDEGGILCHAAIVSREMKKPCIIGTKIATKVLKDGDRVEVDAEKGVVRKS